MIKNLNEKQLFKGIGTVILHFVVLVLLQIPFLYFTENPYIYYLIPNILVMIMFIIIYRKELINNIKDLKKNYKKVLLTTLKFWIIGFIIMYLSSLLINLLPIKTSINQQENINLLRNYQLLEILIACIIAPITEEIVFRLSFKGFTDNKWFYSITTGLIFAGVHILSSISNPLMLIHIIPYAALGIAFGYAYANTDNIYGTMLMHALHNTISILELLIIGGIIL